MKDPLGELGIFGQAGISGTAGLLSGFAGSASVGAGGVIDHQTMDSAEVGGYVSAGDLVGGGLHSTTLEGTSLNGGGYGVAGLGGGITAGVTLTNATSFEQLEGMSSTLTVNIGIATVEVSTSDNGVWTVHVGAGAKAELSGANYPTATKTGTIYKTKQNDK